MTIAYFLAFSGARAQVSDADRERFAAIVGAVPRLRKALVFTPQGAGDPFREDAASPVLAAQLYFADIADLEAALARGGPLQALAAPGALPSLAGAAATQQAMLARGFPVPDPVFRTAPGAPHCSFLVSYEGRAEDLNAWLDHYITQHPPIMARFPGIREIEVCTRIDWRGFLRWPRVEYMLRNKVVFDSAVALAAALDSPVMRDMRADYRRFPPFSGPVSHTAMATRAIVT